jgi:hypothetical protein
VEEVRAASEHVVLMIENNGNVGDKQRLVQRVRDAVDAVAAPDAGPALAEAAASRAPSMQGCGREMSPDAVRPGRQDYAYAAEELDYNETGYANYDGDDASSYQQLPLRGVSIANKHRADSGYGGNDSWTGQQHHEDAVAPAMRF